MAPSGRQGVKNSHTEIQALGEPPPLLVFHMLSTGTYQRQQSNVTQLWVPHADKGVGGRSRECTQAEGASAREIRGDRETGEVWLCPLIRYVRCIYGWFVFTSVGYDLSLFRFLIFHHTQWYFTRRDKASWSEDLNLCLQDRQSCSKIKVPVVSLRCIRYSPR